VRVYRIEHSQSQLGPFQHAQMDQSAVIGGVRAGPGHMLDIDHHPKVKSLLKERANLRFGWDSMLRLNAMVGSKAQLTRCGFILVIYDTIPLYRSECGQIIFDPTASIRLLRFNLLEL
jgi:hypothetical protein